MIYDKFCYDDTEMNVPKELKFYDYQSNDKYTNKYIVFDNLYSKIVLKWIYMKIYSFMCVKYQ